jgi:hypothetical protein
MTSAAQQTTEPAPDTQAETLYNACTHGIHAQAQVMFDEAAEDLADLTAELHQQYIPADATERFLVDTLVSNEWRLRRMRNVETDLWQTGVNTYIGKHAEIERATSGDALATIGPTFERLQRIVNSCERNYHRALKQLVALQVARAHGLRTQAEQALSPARLPSTNPKPSPQPQHSTTSSAKLASFIQNPQAPVPTPAKPVPAAYVRPHFPTVDEAIDAAFLAISKESSKNL